MVQLQHLFTFVNQRYPKDFIIKEVLYVGKKECPLKLFFLTFCWGCFMLHFRLSWTFCVFNLKKMNSLQTSITYYHSLSFILSFFPKKIKYYFFTFNFSICCNLAGYSRKGINTSFEEKHCRKTRKMPKY